MKRLAASRHFQSQLKKLPARDRTRTLNVLKNLLSALQAGTLPRGLGFKKINGDKYKVRVDIRIRIVMQVDGDKLVCHFVGNHEEVRRYLRAYRKR